MLDLIVVNPDPAVRDRELEKLDAFAPNQLLGVGGRVSALSLHRPANRGSFGVLSRPAWGGVQFREDTLTNVAERCKLFEKPVTLVLAEGHTLDEVLAVWVLTQRWRLAGDEANDATPGFNRNPFTDPWCSERLDELIRTLIRGVGWRENEPDEPAGRPSFAALRELYDLCNDPNVPIEEKLATIATYVEDSARLVRR